MSNQYVPVGQPAIMRPAIILLVASLHLLHNGLNDKLFLGKKLQLHGVHALGLMPWSQCKIVPQADNHVLWS